MVIIPRFISVRLLKFVVLVELDGGGVVLELPRRHGRPLVELLGAGHAVELLPVAVHVVTVEGVKLERVADLQVLAVDDELGTRLRECIV